MNKFLSAFAVVGVAALAPAAFAQTATQDVNYEVQAINQIAFTGTPSLTITGATAGSAPTSVSDSGSYAIATNESNRTVTAELDTDMPAGVTLSVSLVAPNGGTSAGLVPLTTGPQDVVTGISTLNATGLPVNYTLSATSAAGVVPAGLRTVTYTITAGD